MQPTANSMHSTLSTVALETLGVLRARGPDARSFLQGQLSNDLTLLSADRALLAGYHNPQGRVIALLRVLQVAPDDLLTLLPRELVPTVTARLSKFILRAKVKLADESPAWRISGVLAGADGDAGRSAGQPAAVASLLAALPGAVDSVARFGEALAVQVAQRPARWLLLMPAARPPLVEPDATAEIWRCAAIAAGEPQVYAATSEEFVAQMLNLDVLGAIALDKGCYTGQEVIARAHYRGRVKRRLQRFLTDAPRALNPGDAGTLTDGRAYRVVEAVRRADGRREFLAVAPLMTGESEPVAPGATTAERLDAETLPLPYSLPS
jgi:folate-binding protein YgfZ